MEKQNTLQAFSIDECIMKGVKPNRSEVTKFPRKVHLKSLQESINETSHTETIQRSAQRSPSQPPAPPSNSDPISMGSATSPIKLFTIDTNSAT